MSPLTQIEQHLVTSLLSPEARAQYALGDVGKRELTPHVEALKNISSAYVSHTSGTRLSSPIDSSLAAAAYALYYTPINAAKLLHVSDLLQSHTEPLRVLDLGCGPGTAGLALLASLKPQLALTCVESSPQMRALAKQLLASFPSVRPLAELVMRETLDGLPPASFDIVIAANVFAELDSASAESMLNTLVRAVRSSGYLVLLEPGQLLHTRRLMALRDSVTTLNAGLTPIFPCLRADTCPMLTSSETDWCHGTLEWQQPPLHRQLDDLLGFNKHRIKFSCFIFQEGAQPGSGIRILTPPEKTRSGVEALICGEGIYGIGRVPKRLRSERTRAFEKASVFDRLECLPPFLGDAPDQVLIRKVPQLFAGSRDEGSR